MVSPELADKLGKEGEKEKYLLSMCSGSKEVRYGRRLSGIIARPLDGEQIELSTCTECDSIPEDKREIPTPIMASRFPHLEAIANKISPYDPDAHMSLLIGRDAPECLKVRTFINGPKGAPWTQKLSLGGGQSADKCA